MNTPDITLRKTLTGRILDLGGGGEGVIGRVYGGQVTAIDTRQEELDEAPDGFEKVVMDARQLTFDDATFDHVTAFFTMMYISTSDHEQVLREAYRVLKTGGCLHVWDTAIETAQPFVVQLDIDADGTPVHTGYGIHDEDAAQDARWFKELCEKVGFGHVTVVQTGPLFALRAEKT